MLRVHPSQFLSVCAFKKRNNTFLAENKLSVNAKYDARSDQLRHLN